MFHGKWFHIIAQPNPSRVIIFVIVFYPGKSGNDFMPLAASEKAEVLARLQIFSCTARAYTAAEELGRVCLRQDKHLKELQRGM